MTLSEERIETVLGNSGYTFASATGSPELAEDGESVIVKYFVDAGSRAYVRRITFSGNTLTQDECCGVRCVKWKGLGIQLIH